MKLCEVTLLISTDSVEVCKVPAVHLETVALSNFKDFVFNKFVLLHGVSLNTTKGYRDLLCEKSALR